MAPPSPRFVVMTIKEAAVHFNRSERGITSMCARGTLIASGCKIIKQKPGNWLIYIPIQ